MNVRGTPRIVMIVPRISSRLNRRELVLTVRVRENPSRTREVGIKRRRMIVPMMSVTSRCVGLPNLKQRMRNRTATIIEYASHDDDALAQRFTRMLTRQVAVRRHDVAVTIHRTSDLRQSVWQKNERLPRSAQDSSTIRRIERSRLAGGVMPSIACHLECLLHTQSIGSPT